MKSGNVAPFSCPGQAVKRIEKTRREAHPDLQQERLAYERKVVAWRKSRDQETRAEKDASERAARTGAGRARDFEPLLSRSFSTRFG